MKKIFLNFLKVVTLLIFLSACEEKDEVKLKTSGVYIYNEGAFGSNNATIGNYAPENNEYTTIAFRRQSNMSLGDVQQNALLHNDKIYSVLNGSNDIKIMDANLDYETLIKFSELDKPRDIAVLDDLAFISNWGPYDENFALISSEILVVDLNTNELIDRIETQEYPEHLIIKDNKLIVSHANFDGSISELSVINIDNLEIEHSIDVPTGPQEFEEDENGNIWVVCTSGNLIKLNANLTAIENEVGLDDNVLGDIDAHEDKIYFYSDSEISFLNISDNSITSTGIEAEMETPYAFSVDPVSGDFYLGDALDFSSEGLVIRYDAEGELLDTFESGIAPTQFSFNIESDR
ncbi:MAG: YncE family protein [Bacteroidota bacterium]